MAKRTLTSVVTETIAMEFVRSQDKHVALEADFVFDPGDPFAVTLVFRTAVQEVPWTFGWELLVGGLYEPTGDGDVHLWPCLGPDGCAVVVVELRSPDGRVLLQARSRAVRAFVDKVRAAVPEDGVG